MKAFQTDICGIVTIQYFTECNTICYLNRKTTIHHINPITIFSPFSIHLCIDTHSNRVYTLCCLLIKGVKI